MAKGKKSARKKKQAGAKPARERNPAEPPAVASTNAEPPPAIDYPIVHCPGCLSMNTVAGETAKDANGQEFRWRECRDCGKRFKEALSLVEIRPAEVGE